MKIAFVPPPLDPILPPKQNSIGVWTYEVARRLSKNHEIIVYCNNNSCRGKKRVKMNGATLSAVSIRFDNRLLRYVKPNSRLFEPKRPLFASKLYYLGYILQIALSLRINRCDIVHIHNFSQYVPLVRAFNPDITIILHMHCEWLTQLDQSMIANRVKYADNILSCSEYITQKTRRLFPRFALHCHTLNNGIDDNKFLPDNNKEIKKTGESHKNILFVGRMSPEKGVHILLDAFEKVHEIHPNVHLQLIGPQTPAPEEFIVALSDDPKVLGLKKFYLQNTEDYLLHLRNKISRNLKKHVTFFKYIPHSDLIEFYRNAHVFVFPSVWEEPFGMPIIEAMACGLPVVATNGGGIPEIVENGKTGFLVDRGNSVNLARKILSLLENEDLRKSMGDNAKKKVKELYTWNQISKRLEVYYQNRHITARQCP